MLQAFRWLAATSALVALAACQPPAPEHTFPHAVMTPAASAPPAVPLVGADGKPFALAQLKGRWVWLYFGFTNCPDVCPVAMDYMAEELTRMKHPERVAPVFVSVDPARDRPATLKAFAAFHHKDFLAATGLEPDLRTLTKAFQAGYVIDKPQKPGGDYNVSHANLIFVLDPQGRHIASYVPAPKPGVMAADFDALPPFSQETP